ncbi:hypothetical protein ABMC88_18485, partial [Sulfitobacter sp. HNIBRBA2951]|uniref:hypothetical protein n=1 Tax=Sulfitobacter aquimarinus TaxID=3158557 RepID=UPI0032DEC88D
GAAPQACDLILPTPFCVPPFPTFPCRIWKQTMKRIKIIDVPHYETDPKVIVKQLSKFLKDLRKKKVAIDLIGDDERSAGNPP